jgi:hypothetical protein
MSRRVLTPEQLARRNAAQNERNRRKRLDPEFRAREREWERLWRAKPEVRARLAAKQRERRKQQQLDPVALARQRAQTRERMRLLRLRKKAAPLMRDDI